MGLTLACVAWQVRARKRSDRDNVTINPYVNSMAINDDTIDFETRRKRLIHRAHYRGFKEADMILGGFARDYGPQLNEAEVLMFEDLLGAKDHDIYAWITQTLPVPANYDTPLLERLRAYRPKIG